jgi:hypothetical protein
MSGRQERRRSGADPIANDRRRARKRYEIPPDAACALCGVTTPEALARVNRKVLDGHHVSAETNDPDLFVPLCKNCHAVVTAAQLDAGVDLEHRPRTVLEREAGAARSEAVLFRAFADARERRADQLSVLEHRLDRRYPKWRELPEAQR